MCGKIAFEMYADVIKRKRCVNWLCLAWVPPCAQLFRLFIVTWSWPKCPGTALLAPWRKRAACKAALRHRRITAPRSPFSGILKLGSVERRRYPLVFLCGIYFASSKPSCALSLNSDRRPATCPDGPSPLARVCISSFCMTCLGATKKRREAERLAFVVCVLQWKMKLREPEQEAVPVQRCCCGLDWITESEIFTDSTGRQKGTVSEDMEKSLLLSKKSQGEC